MNRTILLACVLIAAPVLAGCASDAGTKTATPTPTPSAVATPTPTTAATPTLPVDTPTKAEACYEFSVSAADEFVSGEGGTVTASFKNCGEETLALDHACLRGMDMRILKFYDMPGHKEMSGGHDESAMPGGESTIGPEAYYTLNTDGPANAMPPPCATAPPHTREIAAGETLDFSVEWDGKYLPEGCEDADCALPLPKGHYAFVANAIGAEDEMAYTADMEFHVKSYVPCVEGFAGTSGNVVAVGSTVDVVGWVVNCGAREHAFEDPCLNPVKLFVQPEGGNLTQVDPVACATAPPWTRTLAASGYYAAAATWNTTNMTAGNWTAIMSVMNADGTYTNATTAFKLVAANATASTVCGKIALTATNATFKQFTNGTNMTAAVSNCGTGTLVLDHPCLRAMDVSVFAGERRLMLSPGGVDLGTPCATAPPWDREIAANTTQNYNVSWSGMVEFMCEPDTVGCVFPADTGRHLAVAYATTKDWNAATYRWLTIE